MLRIEITAMKRNNQDLYCEYLPVILQKIGIVEQTNEIEKICLKAPMQLVDKKGKPEILTSEKVREITKNK